MNKSIPFDFAGPRFRWNVLDLSDPSNIRPEAAVNLYELPITGEYSKRRLALHNNALTGYPSGIVTGDVHSATFPIVELPARSWDRLWIPVSHDPTATKPTEVTVRLSDGTSDYYWTAGAWTVVPDATTWTSVSDAEANFSAWTGTKLEVKIRLRTEDNKATPSCFGVRFAATVAFGYKRQAAGTAHHPVASSWIDAAIFRSFVPTLDDVDFRWFGQFAVEAGATSLGFTGRLGQLSINVTEVLQCFKAGAAGEGFGDEIAGTWDGSDFVFTAPTAAGEVAFEAAVRPNTAPRPDRDLVSGSLPHVLVQGIRQGTNPEPPQDLWIPDLSASPVPVMKRWRRELYPVDFDLRIEAHTAALVWQLSEALAEWIDTTGGRVILCKATGHRIAFRLTGPPQAGSDFGLPQAIMNIRANPIPHFDALPDAPLVLASGGVTVTIDGDPAVPQ
jgi:hypothetical protein